MKARKGKCMTPGICTVALLVASASFAAGAPTSETRRYFVGNGVAGACLDEEGPGNVGSVCFEDLPAGAGRVHIQIQDLSGMAVGARWQFIGDGKGSPILPEVGAGDFCQETVANVPAEAAHLVVAVGLPWATAICVTEHGSIGMATQGTVTATFL